MMQRIPGELQIDDGTIWFNGIDGVCRLRMKICSIPDEFGMLDLTVWDAGKEYTKFFAAMSFTKLERGVSCLKGRHKIIICPECGEHYCPDCQLVLCGCTARRAGE